MRWAARNGAGHRAALSITQQNGSVHMAVDSNYTEAKGNDAGKRGKKEEARTKSNGTKHLAADPARDWRAPEPGLGVTIYPNVRSSG